MGDEGVIDLDPFGQLRLGQEGESAVIYEQPKVGHDDSNAAFQMNRMQAYCDQLQAFVNTIHGSPGGEGTPADGRAGVAAILAMLESSRKNQLVSLA